MIPLGLRDILTTETLRIVCIAQDAAMPDHSQTDETNSSTLLYQKIEHLERTCPDEARAVETIVDDLIDTACPDDTRAVIPEDK
jgi:hypothetical protein